MEETSSSMNWLAIILAALSSLFVGFIWYHPKVLGTVWMKSIGMTVEDAKTANMAKIFGVTILMSIVYSIYFARQMAYHGTDDMNFGHGIYHGCEAAIYLVMPVIIINALYERRGLGYMLINLGYWVVTFSIAAGILSIWR